MPEKLHPKQSVICRQVPISPFKPSQTDQADICFYHEELREEGTIPDLVIELKNIKADKYDILQVVRYATWLDKLKEKFSVNTTGVEFYLLARGFTRNIRDHIPPKFRDRIHIVEFPSDIKQTTMDEYK